jgi:hypothetical protein
MRLSSIDSRWQVIFVCGRQTWRRFSCCEIIANAGGFRGTTNHTNLMEVFN